MEHSLIDFQRNSKVSNDLLENYKHLVPQEIIDLWQKYGFGTFMDGYFKSVNPEEYHDLLQAGSQRYKDSSVVFATGMGDLVIWADGYVRILNFRYGVLNTVMPSFTFFFKSLDSAKFRDDYLNWQPYPKARNQYGNLAYDECFGYTPLLGIGGPETVENLKKVKVKEHILIITELMGPIE